MPKMYPMWVCNKCGKRWENVDDAEQCEDSHASAFEIVSQGFQGGDELSPKFIKVRMKQPHGEWKEVRYIRHSTWEQELKNKKE